MKLLVDFVSQQGNQYRNDCGAAAVAMCASNAVASNAGASNARAAGVTADDVLRVIEQPRDEALHFQEMYQALRAFGLKFEYVRPLHLPDLRRWLANGNPVVALVGYGQLPPEHKAQRDFGGAHFVLVVGYTPDLFLVHDPLWPDQRGAYREWSVETMGAALLRPGWGNQPLQGIVVQRQYEIVEPQMAELGLAVNAALTSSVATSYLEKLLQAMGITEAGSIDERVAHALAWVAMRQAGE